MAITTVQTVSLINSDDPEVMGHYFPAGKLGGRSFFRSHDTQFIIMWDSSVNTWFIVKRRGKITAPWYKWWTAERENPEGFFEKHGIANGKCWFEDITTIPCWLPVDNLYASITTHNDTNGEKGGTSLHRRARRPRRSAAQRKNQEAFRSIMDNFGNEITQDEKDYWFLIGKESGWDKRVCLNTEILGQRLVLNRNMTAKLTGAPWIKPDMLEGPPPFQYPVTTTWFPSVHFFRLRVKLLEEVKYPQHMGVLFCQVHPYMPPTEVCPTPYRHQGIPWWKYTRTIAFERSWPPNVGWNELEAEAYWRVEGAGRAQVVVICFYAMHVEWYFRQW